MEPYEVPIDEQFRSAIETLVVELASGAFDELVRMGQMALHAVEPTARLIRRGGRSLVPLPIGWWEDNRAVMFPVHEPDEWCAIVPLPTQDGDCGAVWLEAELYVDDSGVRVELEQLFSPQSDTT